MDSWILVLGCSALLLGCPAADDGAATTTTFGMTMGTVGPSSTGEDDGSGGSTEAETGSDESTTGMLPVGCALCVAAAPEGWFGPIARVDGDTDAPAPQCNEFWPDAGLTYLSGFNDPGPAECECECTTSIKALCPISVILDPTMADCSGAETMSSFNNNDGCEPLDDLGLGDDNSIFFFTQGTGTDVCNDERTTTIPDVAWDQQVFACRGAELGEECDGDGRQCAGELPQGFNAGLCIFNEGEHDCPAGDYTERSLLYSGVDDTRNCSQCECAQTPTATCTNEYSLHAEDDCSGATIGDPVPGFMCMDVTGGAAIQVNFTGDPGCPLATPPTPIGEIGPTGPVTYCCQP